MTTAAQQIADAWKVAGVDLGIQVVCPFVLNNAAGNAVEYPVLLPQFGGTRGMLIVVDWGYDTNDDRFRTAIDQGYTYCCLYPEFHGRYQRDGFIEMLTDWGWNASSGAAPAWYSANG
jgi:hypothetical protein